MGRTLLVLVGLVLARLLAAPSPAIAAPDPMVLATVVEERQGFIVLSTPRGFTVGTVLEGYFVGQQQVLGEFHNPGVADVWDLHGNKLGQVEVQDFALDKARTIQWFHDRTEP